jgi:hypothetical protein
VPLPPVDPRLSSRKNPYADVRPLSLGPRLELDDRPERTPLRRLRRRRGWCRPGFRWDEWLGDDCQRRGAVAGRITDGSGPTSWGWIRSALLR